MAAQRTTNDMLADQIRSLQADLRATRTEVTRLAVLARPDIRHGWVGHIAKDLATNPDTQYKVHLYGVVYWLINFPVIVYLFVFQRSAWDAIGIFITLIYSVYANLATDYGAMSSATAAKGMRLPQIPLED